MRPKQFLFSFLDETFLIKDGRFNFLKGKKLIPGEKISKLENYFFRGYTTSKKLDLISYIKNVVIDLKDWEQIKEIDCLQHLLPNPCFLINGKIYEANNQKRGKYITNIYDLAETYEKEIKSTYGDNLFKNYDYNIQKLTNKKGHYWEEHNIGFMWYDSDIYLITRVEPYVLYERKNGKYYRFGEAVIGVKLKLNGNNITYEKPCVINQYSHPALQKANKFFQTICNGDFNYNSLRDKIDGYFFRAMLFKASSMLTKGYFSAGGAWKSLEDPIFQNLEIEVSECTEVSNI